MATTPFARLVHHARRLLHARELDFQPHGMSACAKRRRGRMQHTGSQRAPGIVASGMSKVAYALSTQPLSRHDNRKASILARRSTVLGPAARSLAWQRATREHESQ